MTYDPFGHVRPKRFRKAQSEKFTDSETGAELILVMWKPTGPEMTQAAKEGQRLVELYVTGDPDTGRDPVAFPPVGEQFVTFSEKEYLTDPERIVLLDESVLRGAAQLEAAQPPWPEQKFAEFGTRRYSAIEFAAMFAVWPRDDWEKVSRWTARVIDLEGKAPNSNGATTKQPSPSPSQKEENTPNPSITEALLSGLSTSDLEAATA